MATTLAWRALSHAEAERQYVALITYLPIKHGWQMRRLMASMGRALRQRGRQRGLVGYSLRSEFLAGRFWTLSVWADEGALQGFVRAHPHPRAINTRFIRWTVKGSELPVSWEEALRRWSVDRAGWQSTTSPPRS